MTRSAWPVRHYPLGSEHGANLVATTSAEDRLAMMWELAQQAWALTGRELPDYRRDEIPGRVVRSAP
jgi:hypothetical protein